MDDDVDQDDAKRKSRNLSEKKRRDQFNLLVNELNSMLLPANRKLDKSSVLQTTISFLKQQDEKTAQSRMHEIQENWKPSFLSNEEFSHLMLEAVSGFFLVLSSNGQIQYVSESIIPLLGHLPNDLIGMTIYDLIYEKEHQEIYTVLSNPTVIIDPLRTSLTAENQVCFTCYLKKGGLKDSDDVVYEQMQFVGFFRYDIQSDEEMPSTSSNYYEGGFDPKLLFVGIGRLQTPQLVREMSVVDSSKSEFTSRQSLEWKFLFLDHRATPIIGYLPFEVLGTSGYEYYHFDDLDNIARDQEALMMKGGGTSCFYRFLTKSQQWIWLQTHSYLTYHQWTSKPEFVVCTHRVISYTDVLRQNNNEKRDMMSKSRTKGQKKDDLLKMETMNKRSNSNLKSDPNRHLRLSPTLPAESSKKRLKSYTPSDSNASLSTTQTKQSTQSELQSEKVPFDQSHNATIVSQASASASTVCTADVVRSNHRMSSTAFTDSLQHGTSVPVPVFVSVPVQFLMSDLQPIVIPQPNTAMNPSRSNIQNQLQRKHEELQQAINEQQKELQLVAEQLHMATHGGPLLLNVPNFPEIPAPYFVGPVDADPNTDQSVIRHVSLMNVDQYQNENNYQSRKPDEQPENPATTSDIHMENITDHLSRVVVVEDQYYRDYSHSHQQMQWQQHNQNAQLLQQPEPPQDNEICNLNSNTNANTNANANANANANDISDSGQVKPVNLGNQAQSSNISVHSPSISECQSVENSTKFNR